MEINGIKIRDIKDAQDVLMALETIKSGIENLSDDMSKNYTNYNSLSEDISNSVYSQKELIEGISHLQIKAKTLFDNYQALGKLQKEMNDNNILMLKKEFKEFDRQIKYTMSSVVNGIDLSTFSLQVETLFNDKISSLESEVRRLNNNNNDLEKLNTTIKSTLKTAKTEMSDSIEDFNRLVKVVNWKVILSVGFGGMFLGALIMGGWGLQFFKDKIFKDEQIALQELQSVTNNIKAGGLEKFVAENKIDIGFGYFNDTKEPYIYLAPNSYINSWTNEKNNYYIIKTKEYK